SPQPGPADDQRRIFLARRRAAIEELILRARDFGHEWIAYNTRPHVSLARDDALQLARMATSHSRGHPPRSLPLGDLHLLAAGALRFGSGDLRFDGKAHRRRTGVPALHVRSDLHSCG